ncbi:MAG: adenosylcobinamide-phosphate synthase CbiB [Phyllobacterium sp.]
MEATLMILFLALLLDRFAGDPDWLWKAIPHPVVIFGKAISFIDRNFNATADVGMQKRRNGTLSVAALLLVAAVSGFLLHCLFRWLLPFGYLIELLIVAVLLAQKSLGEHVRRVAMALREEGLEGARRAVSMIVGRDPKALDEAGVSRAAIESLAENSSDGVVAPAFWYLVLGLPGIFAYKLLNTADSMVGHMNERYRDFGWFAAKADDVANWIPARLTGGLIALASWLVMGRHAAARSFKVMMRDAGLHRSPNAGWPESAMAGALGLALAGPRIYAGDIANEPMLNGAGRRDANADDIRRALSIIGAMNMLLAGLVLLLWLACIG